MTPKYQLNRVSTVIPTYNGLALLKKNLPAVISCLADGDEIVVVDDASTDGTIQWFDQQFLLKNWKLKKKGKTIAVKIGKFQQAKKTLRVVLVPNKKNLRFARSVNKGVLAAKNDLIFLLNNDVSPHSDCLRYLTPHFRNESVFAVGCLELEEKTTAAAASDSKNISIPKGKVVGGKNHLFFTKGIFQHRRADDFSAGPTAWVSGGSGMFHKEKWHQLLGFDAAFAPAYWEDIDLSYRARKKGWQVLFEPKAKVDHNHESTNKDAFGEMKILKMSWKNADLFTQKNGNFVQKLSFYLWKPYWWWKRHRHLISLKNGIITK